MNPSISMSSYWFYISMFFLIFTNIYTSSAFFSSSETFSYSDHCSSIVPESTPTVHTQKNLLPYFVTSYFIGGDKLLDKKPSNQNQSYYYIGKSLKFPVTPYYYETKTKGIYKVEAYLYIRSPYRYYNNNARQDYTYGKSYYHSSRTHWSASVRSLLTGFYSEKSRSLCMVGSATWEYDEVKARNLDVFLKLNYASDNPSMYTSIVSGTFGSTSPSDDDFGYFDSISMYNFPVLPNYNYSLVSEELDGGFFTSDYKVPKNQSLNLQPNRFCRVLSGRFLSFELKYSAECKTDKYNILPRFLSLNPIQCSRDDRKIRYMITFQNISYGALYQTFGLNSTFIGEASWDDTSNQLFIVACRILDQANRLGNAVGDCTTRLSLRYPSIWNIRNDAKIVGQIWSNLTVNDSGYFRKIKLTSSNDNDVFASQGLRYEYTELDRVIKSCPAKKLVRKTGNTYPNARSKEMRFGMSIKNAKGKRFGWGEAVPRFVGNELNVGNHVLLTTMSEPEKSTNAALNISYKIRITRFHEVSVSNWYPMEISAEGVYDAETGHLCMIGCRKLLSYVQTSTNGSLDCEILVSFEFSPLNDRRGGLIKGAIRSTRANTDPLRFDDLILSSAAFYPNVAKRYIWRMDLEITMVLVSNTLLCIFVGLQLFHVKRNPDVISGISLIMVLILSLEHLIPLVFNFEVVFSSKQKIRLSNSGWLEANEVAVRVVTMVAFLLQIRLLQLVWTAKMNEMSEKGSWIGEKKASSFILVPMYIFGGLITLVLNQTRHSPKYSLYRDLRSYAGLILDGFLLPQILLNAFRGTTDKALFGPFYIGASAVRLVPHAYDQYRAHNYPTSHVNGTYYYANPTADFYSTAWDIMIPCGVIALAVVVFLQQRHGGRCILPKRFRELELYEKVPVLNNEQFQTS